MSIKRVLVGCLLAVVASTAVLAFGAAAAGKEKGPGAALRVGTFDPRGVALAYGRSERPDCLLAKVTELKKEHAKAELDGDTERVEELEAEGQALQHEAHLQVFCGVGVEGILDMIHDDLPEIARSAGVDLIVTGILFEAPGAEVLDITHQMAEPFGPDEETMKMIEEIKSVPAIDPSELDEDHE